MFIELEDDNLVEYLQSNEVVFVQFSASWCGNCRIIKPRFKKLSEEFENQAFIVVDAERFPNSRKLADVKNLPTFAKFVDGKLIKQIQTNQFESLKNFIYETSNH